MRVDIYRRPEADAKFSYLAVPEGKPLPEEVTNTDWHTVHRAATLDDGQSHWDEFGIDQPAAQIGEKGYAITSLAEQQPG